MRTFIKKSAFAKTVTPALLTPLSALLIAPGSAQADDPRCAADHFCLFENTNFGGGARGFTFSVRDFSGAHYNNGVPLPNSASSMINNTGHTITLGHRRLSCGAPVYTAQAHSVDSTFVNNSFNDQANCLVFI